jgi:S-DNA-T family DNA segregation ATPase FtsK/SpoIIIE
MNNYHRFNAPHIVMDGRGGEKEKLNLPPRFYIYAVTLLLGVLAVVFTFSISASLFGVPAMNSALGDFFSDSYGILSFAIPAYFIFAAIILLDNTFRPRSFFFLNSALFPFLTLAVSFSFIRDYDYYAGQFSLLDAVGKNGFSFITVAFTMLECFIITSLASVFFPASPARKAPVGDTRNRRNNNSAANNQNNQNNQNQLKILRIPLYKKETTEVPKEYTAAFDVSAKLAEFEDVIPADVLDASLETLNSKLSVLKNDIGTIDFKFDKLDRNINTLKNELDGMTGARSIAENNIETDDELNIEDAELIEMLEEAEIDEFEELDAIDAAPELLQSGISCELEDIISEAEAAAEKKTEEVLKKRGEDSKKKNAPLKSPEYASKKYSIPIGDVLQEYEGDQYGVIDYETKEAAQILTDTLEEFNIKAVVTGIKKGPVVTSFEILPSPGVKLSKIVNLQDNIALRLAAASVRIVAPIPGKHAVGIEIPNKKRNVVSFREIIEGELNNKSDKKAQIPVVLGKDITGDSVTVDLATMPHLLIAGSTGSGKSVCVNTLILSILYQCTPAQCKLILIDPKIVELKLYNDIGHLLTPVITEPKRAFQALQYCLCEMERRYACLDGVGVRDIKTYNKRIKERGIAAEHMPYIVVVIDEFADLMATTGKELESTVARLAAMSRAVGIHLVLATQRPSIDVITGLIKSNMPSRIAFMVASGMDSRIIIDMTGAEKLLGKGDMLYSGITEPYPIRMQGAFVSEDEVERVVEQVKKFGEPEYIDEEIFFDEDDAEGMSSVFEDGDDPLYNKAMDVVVQQGRASASYIQRRLKIGYNRAARLVEEMEHRGVVGPAQGSRPRELLRAV